MPPMNPYLNRLPVSRADEFYGRERDLRWLLERILHPQPQCCSVTGFRRIGKTSLLNYLAFTDGARNRYADLFEQSAEGLLLVYADLSLPGPGVVAQEDQANDLAATGMLAHLLRALDRETRGQIPLSLSEQLGRNRRDAEKNWHGYLDALVDALDLLADEGYRVVFLLDELDVMETLPSRLAQALRALVMENNIGYVTASLNPLHELLLEGRTSPLYNLFSTHPLGLLDREEARALLTEPARQQGVGWPDALTEELLDLVGGHPDLIKMAGSQLWDLLHESGAPPAVEEVVTALRVDANGLFQSIWDHLSREERQALFGLATGTEPVAIASVLRSLRQRALVVGEEAPQLFTPLFTQWVREHPGAPERKEDVRLEGRWIVVEGDKRQLTPTEAKLAKLLLQRRGQTVSREYLQQAIWNQVDADSKALDTTVQRLRDKIEADRANPRWLVTVRGEGYAFR